MIAKNGGKVEKYGNWVVFIKKKRGRNTFPGRNLVKEDKTIESWHKDSEWHKNINYQWEIHSYLYKNKY